MQSLSDPDTLRRVLNQIARKMDGSRAAATVVARKRAVLYNLLGYAVDKKHFAANPLASLSWKSPKPAEAIDRRRVINPAQAQDLLDAVHDQGPMGRHLKAFFGVMYYAGLRPSEAVMLTLDELDLPERDNEWGWLNLGDSAPSTGGAWNDSGNRRQPQALKHRAVEEVRPVPASPALVRLLREHIAEHGTATDGRLFRGEAGGLLSDSVYSRSWDKARQAALTEAQVASPLGGRPYDLRHARLSTWLNADVEPARAALRRIADGCLPPWRHAAPDPGSIRSRCRRTRSQGASRVRPIVRLVLTRLGDHKPALPAPGPRLDRQPQGESASQGYRGQGARVSVRVSRQQVHRDFDRSLLSVGDLLHLVGEADREHVPGCEHRGSLEAHLAETPVQLLPCHLIGDGARQACSGPRRIGSALNRSSGKPASVGAGTGAAPAAGLSRSPSTYSRMPGSKSI